jgi:hypothetical protein
MLGLIRSVLGALPDDPTASRHSESVGQSACFESKGRIRGYLAAIPTYIIMLACPTPSAPPRCCRMVRGEHAGYCRAASCRIAIMRSTTSSTVVPNRKLDLLLEVLQPKSFGRLAIADHFVNPVVFSDAPR